jgi:ABC-type transport system involved in multi-copper enzyme maturation permease subunit
MIALLWKEWRLVRPLWIACGVLFVTPAIVVLIAALLMASDGPKDSRYWGEALTGASMAGHFLTMFTIPMFAAVMFARERRERSAELVGTLPISRGRIVLSKSIVAVASSFLPWILVGLSLTILILVFLHGSAKKVLGDPDDGAMSLVYIPVCISVAAFGLAWLFSALWSSETLAAGVALLVTAMLASSLALFMYNKNLTNTWGIWQPYAVLLAPLGIASYIAGTMVALRRASP